MYSDQGKAMTRNGQLLSIANQNIATYIYCIRAIGFERAYFKQINRVFETKTEPNVADMKVPLMIQRLTSYKSG